MNGCDPFGRYVAYTVSMARFKGEHSTDRLLIKRSNESFLALKFAFEMRPVALNSHVAS